MYNRKAIPLAFTVHHCVVVHPLVIGHLKCIGRGCINSFGAQKGGSSEPLEPPLPMGLHCVWVLP